jgi:hypothetical protein
MIEVLLLAIAISMDLILLRDMYVYVASVDHTCSKLDFSCAGVCWSIRDHPQLVSCIFADLFGLSFNRKMLHSQIRTMTLTASLTLNRVAIMCVYGRRARCSWQCH